MQMEIKKIPHFIFVTLTFIYRYLPRSDDQYESAMSFSPCSSRQSDLRSRAESTDHVPSAVYLDQERGGVSSVHLDLHGCLSPDYYDVVREGDDFREYDIVIL